MDKVDVVENYIGRDISHLTSTPNKIEDLYSYRLSSDQKEELHNLFKDTFAGTKKYHNFTREMRPEQTASQRFMIELKANDYMYVN